MNPIEYLKVRLLFLIIPMILLSCSDTKDEPIDGDDAEYEAELSFEEMAYSLIVGNFYQGNEPAKGSALDVARPAERSEICESYELALQDFERYLPYNQECEAFISRQNDAIVINLNEFGSVKFYREAGNGIVARIDISLKDVQEYSVLYRLKSSFDDNYGSDIYLNELFNPGDAVLFPCPGKVRYPKGKIENGEWPKWNWKTCGETCNGVVVESYPDRIYVFSNHTHHYELEDYWKGGDAFYCDVVSEEGWKRIYRSWQHNYKSFMRTDENYRTSESITICHLMQGKDESPQNYVCVNGNDQRLHKTLYWGHYTWYSHAYRINKNDLKDGVFTVSSPWFAYRDGWGNPDCNYYYMLIEINRDQAETVKKIYPVN